MKEIRFGIIGCGLMGREFASAAARWLHLVNPKAKPRIVAVCDTNPTLMDWFAGHLGPIQTTTDYRALLANPEVDAVYCAVPHVLHEQMYPEILNAGKHLFGEKPFGMDLAQNRAIMAAVAAQQFQTFDLVERSPQRGPVHRIQRQRQQLQHAVADGLARQLEGATLAVVATVGVGRVGVAPVHLDRLAAAAAVEDRAGLGGSAVADRDDDAHLGRLGRKPGRHLVRRPQPADLCGGGGGIGHLPVHR